MRSRSGKQKLAPVIHCPMEHWLTADPEPGNRQLRRVSEKPWTKSVLTVAIDDCQMLESTSGVARSEAVAAIGRSLATWNAVGLPITFQLLEPNLNLPVVVGSSSSVRVDVIVQWYIAASDPERVFSVSPGPGAVHAHTDFPPGNSLFGGPPLPIHFNASMLWGIEVSGCFDIETIALHELAHILGLIYHSGPGTILYDALPPAPIGIMHHLDSETQTRARALYSS